MSRHSRSLTLQRPRIFGRTFSYEFSLVVSTKYNTKQNHVEKKMDGHLNPGPFNPRIFNHELFNAGHFNIIFEPWS